MVKGLPSSIRAVGTYSVGMDHLDVPTIKASGRVALFTPDVLKDAVADTAILLMLGATRRATESINLIRSDEWQGWHSRQLIGQGLAGKIFGVFGMGRIGLAAAARARAFGMRIAYHNRRRLAPEIEDGARYIADADAFLAETDVLLLASPLTPDTHHFLNDQRIAMMRPTAVVLNVGRGDIIDDNALIPALQDGRVYAAGLDVLAGEPAFDSTVLEPAQRLHASPYWQFYGGDPCRDGGCFDRRVEGCLRWPHPGKCYSVTCFPSGAALRYIVGAPIF